jgi:hypothetical protein
MNKLEEIHQKVETTEKCKQELMALAITPKPGQYLWSSCAADDYGKILSVGQDANGVDSMDIELCQLGLEDLLSFEEGLDPPPLTRLVVQGTAILRDVQWKMGAEYEGEWTVILNSPGEGCYRCTKLLWLHDEKF